MVFLTWLKMVKRTVKSKYRLCLLVLSLIPWLVYLPGKIYLLINNKSLYDVPILGQDFHTYYQGWKSFLNGDTLYTKGYFYPPFTAIFSFLAYFDYNIAFAIFSLINVVFVILTYFELKKVIGKFYSLVTIASYSSYLSLFFGQINYIVFYLLIKGINLYKKNRNLSILLLSLSSSIKLFPIFLVPFIFKRSVKSYLIFILLVMLLNSIAIVNPSIAIEFINNLQSFGKSTGGISIIDLIPSRNSLVAISIPLFYIISCYLYKKLRLNYVLKLNLILYLLFTLTHFWMYYVFMVYPIILKGKSKLKLPFLTLYTLRTPILYVMLKLSSKLISTFLYYIPTSILSIFLLYEIAKSKFKLS